MQKRHLLEPHQLLPQLHLQAVAPPVFPLQMLDGADTPDRGRGAALEQVPDLRERGRYAAGRERSPQLAGHQDGHAVAHGLRLLHVVRGEHGPPLAVLEGSANGSPAGRRYEVAPEEHMKGTGSVSTALVVSPHALLGLGVHP